MKYLKLFLAFIVVAVGTAGFSQIGIQTNSPDASSALDIVSANKGLLVPRVTLTANLGSPSPVTTPATGLLVFNIGSNQPQGFYYWDGTSWTQVSSGGGSGTAWELTGNSGTTVGTNFLGTTDAEALALYTNNIERMRILDDGRITIENGYTAPGSDDKFTVRADATHNDAISGTSAVGYGVYGYSGGTYGIYGHSQGTIAVRARSQHITGTGILGTGNDVSGSYPTTGSGGAFTGGAYGVYAKALNTAGTGIATSGNNVALSNPSSGAGGAFSGSDYGAYIRAKDAAGGTGVAAAGNNQTISTLTSGSGGSFKGAKYGSYSKATNTSNGNGVAGVGNGGSTVYVPPGGSGGSFVADSIGLYGKGLDSNGNGVVGRGTGGSTYHYPTTGAGGAFTGAVGVYGYSDVVDGNAVVGSVLGESYSTPGGGGTGGSFSGPFGVYAKATISAGTGVVGIGNDGGNYHTLPDGSGGSFSGFHGVYGYAEDEDDGIGVVGIGNDESGYATLGYGAGGVFEGTRIGLEAYASETNNSTYAIYGKYTGGSRDGRGVFGYSVPNTTRGYGVVGQGGKLGVYSINSFGSTGNMVSQMDHPLDPKNKILNHYAMESPEVLNMYRGNIILDGDGEAIVTLPEYFSEININFSYNLTPIGQQAPNLFIKQEVDKNGSFVVAGGQPNQKISWVVYAERNDLYMQREKQNKTDLVEIEKEPENIGKYLMPELYNETPEQGIFYNGSNSEKKVDKKRKAKTNKSNQQKDVAEKEIQAKELEVKEVKEKEDD